MKTSITRSKSSLALCLALCSLPALAKPVGLVTQVKGTVFVMTPDGNTKTLKAKDLIEDKSDVMVGEDGAITINDYYDATYHLTQGSHLKFFDKSVQLKNGKSWIQSQSARHPLALTTANGHVGYWKGEFITTFNQVTAKSQILVVNGDVEVSNILDKDLKHIVNAGTFTIIDPEVEKGTPRAPTKVGLSSLNSALAEFKVLPQKLKEPETQARAIASVEEAPVEMAPAKESPVAPKGEIMFISKGKLLNRLPASAPGSAHAYFKQKVSKKVVSKAAAPIRYYGMNSKVNAAVSQVRFPASVKPISSQALPKKVGAELNIDSDFSNSLRQEKDNQPKHPKELENLIQDLKSY